MTKGASDRRSGIRPLAIVGLAGLAGLVALVLAATHAADGLDADAVATALESAWSAIRSAPAPLYFGAMTFLCILPVPITAFYVAAGPIYGVVPSLLWIAPCLVVNQLLAHVLASSVLRGAIERLLEGRGYTVPRIVRPGDQTVFTLLVRITPGVPYFLQNLMLGVAGVERGRYLAISLPAQMMWATGFVVLGRSAFEGELGLAAGAGAGLLVASLGARFAYRRLRRRTALVPVMGPADGDGNGDGDENGR